MVVPPQHGLSSYLPGRRVPSLFRRERLCRYCRLLRNRRYLLLCSGLAGVFVRQDPLAIGLPTLPLRLFGEADSIFLTLVRPHPSDHSNNEETTRHKRQPADASRLSPFFLNGRL